MVDGVDVQQLIDALADALKTNTQAKLDDIRYVSRGWWVDTSKNLLQRGKTKIRLEALRDGTITFVDGDVKVRRRPDGSWLVKRNGRYREIGVDDVSREADDE